jgi:hypothetical protein
MEASVSSHRPSLAPGARARPLAEDAQREVGRAAFREQPLGDVQIDVVAARELGRLALGLAGGTKLLVPPFDDRVGRFDGDGLLVRANR